MAEKDLSVKWEGMQAKKSDMIQRCEQYATWTVPSVCPQEEEDGAEQTKGNVPSGARLVNHLANKVTDTMFPSDRPFFSLPLSSEAEAELSEELQGDEEAKDEYTREIKKATKLIEDQAMRKLNLTLYRPVAINTVQHLIITGNAVILRTESDERVVYGIKDFCISRDLRGNMLEVVLCDKKEFKALPDKVKLVLRGEKEYKDEDKVSVYTYFYKEEGKWARVQGVDALMLPDSMKTYKDDDLPVLPLTWNLSRGENYGRGLVEDHAVTFHNIDVTVLAMLDLIGIAADLKFLVNPASTIDIEEWNMAARGAYLPGRKDDISVPDFPKRLELEFMANAVQKWEQELAQSFLLSSAGVRQAERVTAEEIRFVARELESAFGGLYSTLSLGWQYKEAIYLISKVDFSIEGKDGKRDFDVVVTTGLESLSREGQLDQLRLALADLQMLEQIPEDMRNVMDKRAFAEFVFTNRGMKLGEFVLSEKKLAEQAQQQQQAAQAEQQQLAQTQVAQAAGQAAAQEQ